MQLKLFEFFTTGNHNCLLNGFTVTSIDKTHGSDLTRTEKYWKKVVKIVAPYGN